MNKRKAFTLTEILIAVGVIGVVSALTVPNLVNGQQRKAQAVALSKAYATINHMTTQITTDSNSVSLKESKLFKGVLCYPSAEPEGNGCEDSYGNKSKLLNLVPQYLKVTKTCSGAECDSILYDFPNTIENGKLKIQGAKKKLSVDTNLFSQGLVGFYTADGMIYYMAPVGGALYAAVDVNGEQGPNIEGRDFYRFYICNNGTIISYGTASDYSCTLKPEDASNYPFNHLLLNGWNMDY